MAGLLGKIKSRSVFLKKTLTKVTRQKIILHSERSVDESPCSWFASMRNYVRVLPPYRSGILLRRVGDLQEVFTIFLQSVPLHSRSLGIEVKLRGVVDRFVSSVRDSVAARNGELAWIGGG
jgi:hypothetical protein